MNEEEEEKKFEESTISTIFNPQDRSCKGYSNRFKAQDSLWIFSVFELNMTYLWSSVVRMEYNNVLDMIYSLPDCQILKI